MNGTIDLKKVGVKIKLLRQQKELTQLELGEYLGYSERQVRRLETDGTNSIWVINLIAEAFNVSAISILMDC